MNPLERLRTLASGLGIPRTWADLVAGGLIGGFPGALVGILFAVVAPKRYDATAQLAIDAPSQFGALGDLAGIAAQFGVATANGTSPFYFAQLTSNTDVLERLLDSPIAVGDTTVVLMNLYRPGVWANPALRLQKAMRDLSEDINVSTDIKSGLVTVTVTQSSPAMAVAVADSLVSAMDVVGRQRLRIRARAEREYAQTALDGARHDLVGAEDALEHFYEENRAIEGSPRLKLAESRLQREIDLRQSIVLTLQQNLENARLEEIRSTPLLTVVQHPIIPGKPSWPKKSVMAIFGFAVCGLLAAALVHRKGVTSGPGERS